MPWPASNGICCVLGKGAGDGLHAPPCNSLWLALVGDMGVTGATPACLWCSAPPLCAVDGQPVD